MVCMCCVCRNVYLWLCVVCMWCACSVCVCGVVVVYVCVYVAETSAIYSKSVCSWYIYQLASRCRLFAFSPPHHESGLDYSRCKEKDIS